MASERTLAQIVDAPSACPDPVLSHLSADGATVTSVAHRLLDASNQPAGFVDVCRVQLLGFGCELELNGGCQAPRHPATRSCRRRWPARPHPRLSLPLVLEDSKADAAAMLAALAPLYAELGLSLPEVHAPFDPPSLLAGQLVVVAEERVPVFSFTFGIPPPEEIRESGAGSAGRRRRSPRQSPL